jgi:hypothetical protein
MFFSCIGERRAAENLKPDLVEPEIFIFSLRAAIFAVIGEAGSPADSDINSGQNGFLLLKRTAAASQGQVGSSHLIGTA